MYWFPIPFAWLHWRWQHCRKRCCYMPQLVSTEVSVSHSTSITPNMSLTVKRFFFNNHSPSDILRGFNLYLNNGHCYCLYDHGKIPNPTPDYKPQYVHVNRNFWSSGTGPILKADGWREFHCYKFAVSTNLSEIYFIEPPSLHSWLICLTSLMISQRPRQLLPQHTAPRQQLPLPSLRQV